MYEVNLYVSSISMVFVCMNLTILMTNKAFAHQYKILIALNFADAIILIGIFLEGFTRRANFSHIIETGKALVVSSSDCIEIWTVVQVYGDFAMPLIELTMGVERFAAVMFPSFYRSTFHQTSITFIVLSFVAAGIATIIPAAVSLIWPTPNVRYLCGRKAAFGTPFGVADYAFNVTVITMALTLNVATCIRAMTIRQSIGTMRKIKCYTVIAVVSTVLISIPNLFSIIHATWFTMPDALMTPAPILACVNCSLQFFINFSMNEEYRSRFLKLATVGRYKPSSVATVQGTKSSSTHPAHTNGVVLY
uniref:G protein-coupled receptor n=1 Tax=Panagrellus redivivus TaxID=6233 RepID=A0A7E4V6G2_PANRE